MYENRERITDVKSFIHPEWYNRNPSSGENAILNLFSRLYTINAEINSSQIKYYIIFLDEGDAGFHPAWKKKYIEILTTIYQLAFSAYSDDDKVSMRPFSKFKRDILTELGIIT